MAANALNFAQITFMSILHEVSLISLIIAWSLDAACCSVLLSDTIAIY